MIEFIIGNGFFFIILIGIVSSLYKKAKNAYRGTPKSPQTEIEQSWSDQPSGPERAEKVKVDIPGNHLERSTIFHDERLETSINIERLETAAERKRFQAGVLLNQREDTPSGGPVLSSFTRNNLVQGLIMAEILGRPRGRNPYKRRR
ncbi:hypothetical protein [Peribacillus kribbensis]|uniref:hypothetical protein n=1 Tax=Peribacillus kribbensis TaxID=356658 RepID=UPI0004041CCB|nr:hypothetical protein [Peribacillus kribbensis]